jgi:peptidyl-dipeptidase A
MRSAGELFKHHRLAQLVFTRWAQVMIHFERALYRDPDQDLDTLWWELVERFQSVRRPDGRAFPDWAAKSHVVSAPVYYHNYLLGELLASQISNCVRVHVPPSGGETRAIFADPAAGRYLKEVVFEPGARYRWNKLIERATGEHLTPKHFVGEFANDPNL